MCENESVNVGIRDKPKGRNLEYATPMSLPNPITKVCEPGQMYDELRRSFATFQRNVNQLTLNIKGKKSSCICDK